MPVVSSQRSTAVEKKKDEKPLTEEELRELTEQNGDKGDYASSDDKGGGDVFLYQYQFSEGYCYLYVNQSTDLTLKEDIAFDLTNLECTKYPEDTCFSITVPPGESHFLVIKRLKAGLGCKIKLSRKFGLNAVESGDKLSVRVSKEKEDTSTGALRARILTEGSKQNFGDANPKADGIFKYKMEYTKGYVFLFKNSSTDKTLEDEITFLLENLEIQGYEGQGELTLILPPGEESLFVLREIDPQKAYKVKLSSSYAISDYHTSDKHEVKVGHGHCLQVSYSEEELRRLAERDGEVKDYSVDDSKALGIKRYYYNYKGGYALLFKNESKLSQTLDENLKFELENLHIEGQGESNELRIVVNPGESDLLVLKQTDPNAGAKLKMSTSYIVSEKSVA